MGIFQNIDTTPPISITWKELMNLIATFKRQIQGYQVQFASDATAGVLISMTAGLASYRSKLAAYSSVSELTTFAQTELSNPSVDMVAYIQSLTAAIDAVLAWISGAVPSSGGYNLIIKINSDGTYTWRVFTASQLAGLRAQLVTLLAAI